MNMYGVFKKKKYNMLNDPHVGEHFLMVKLVIWIWKNGYAVEW